MAAQIATGRTQADTKRGHRARCIVRGGHGAAAKVVRDLSAMFSFAQSHRLLAQNACVGVRKRSDGSKERYLTVDELGRLGTALGKALANGANPMAVHIIRLLALTGCRRNEIAGLRWVEVDFENECLRLAQTKTGKSVRPLGHAAMQLLLAVRQERRDNSIDAAWVFPATSGTSHFQGLKRVWHSVMQLAGLNDCTPHTLRHTLASQAASNGESLPMIGALLGHKHARSTSRYAHIARSPSKDAMDRHTSRIHGAMQGADSLSSRTTQ
jgi:integrase